MAEDRRLSEIRLPLQIGTSALWSLARTSVFFPSIVLMVLGVYWCITLWKEWEKLALAAGGAVAVGGGMLFYYAWRHARLALDERPSDVVLDAKGLRVEGGERDGLSIEWPDVDPQACKLLDETEKRFVLWRMIADIPLVAISVAAESGELMLDPSEEVPVQRLYVATKDGTSLLVAEADIDIERASLKALHRTIQSPRWYGEAAAEDRKAAAASSVVCPGCGANAAPSVDETVRCRFCGGAVAVPADVRERVRAAQSLSSARSAGMARLERLLQSQPSARFANTAMWVAAVPIALAWPLAGALIVRNGLHGTLTAERGLSLAVLPLLLTFGAFLLARGRLTDRFALHAVVIGFGARDPVRPGEPYRCRACVAALPDATTSPVVHCAFCNAANILGLDLHKEANEAESEQAQLASAMDARERERWLWAFGSIVSLALLAASVGVVRSSWRELMRPAAPPAKFVALHWQAKASKGGAAWDVSVEPSTQAGQNCVVSLRSGTYAYERGGLCTFAGDSPVRYKDGKLDLRITSRQATLSDRAVHVELSAR